MCKSLGASQVKASMERKLFIFLLYLLSQCLKLYSRFCFLPSP
ncbi:unnamed protein product [Brassica oleracea var. botrytis]